MGNIKTILGLDLGTNSIGWALIQQNFEDKYGRILGMGSRIIPMSQDILGKFADGNSISQTAERTRLRSVRRLKERHLLRRERMHRVLNVLGFLPAHYANSIDFEIRLGKFLPETEAKFAYDARGSFIFKDSFDEMLADFKEHQPQLLNRKNRKGEDAKIPYDWTIYYLRKKALTKRISNEELAWLLLHFNQKRGYYQLRGEETDEKQNKAEEFYSLKVVDVTADEPQKGKSDIWYNIILENDWVYRRASKLPLYDWMNKVRDFIVTTELNADGSIKKRSFRSPKDDDWQLLKKKTESDIDKSNKTVGAYIYDTLLQKPDQKIRGKLVRTIERKFYKEELKQIIQKQIELNPILRDGALYKQCVEELYPYNAGHQALLLKKGFEHLFIEDILFYQRPLRSQKGSISNCPLEYKVYVHEGTKKHEPLKCIPKSHPLYQEFRLWQWISNLRIYKTGDEHTPITKEFLPDNNSYAQLFEFLNGRKEINNKTLMEYLLSPLKLKGKALTAEINKYKWNYVFDAEATTQKSYPCNETLTMISGRMDRVNNVPAGFLTKERVGELWHVIYSVTDKTEYETALRTFANKYELDAGSFFEAFRRFPPFPNEYGSYSAKAIKKLLPLMRTGKYWEENMIDKNTRQRIDKIINAEYDETIKDRVREKALNLREIADFQQLPEWLAKYVVYDRHSEHADAGKWKTVADMEAYINEFRQHSLRNPIVEQVLMEALRVVRDIWLYYGNGAENYFDEIHIELGREMKNPSAERKRLTEQITKNENTNLRIKALLAELLNDPSVENVRPYSPMQQEILKVYEDAVLNDANDLPDDIVKISKMSQPTSSELQRYKLWLEQKYRSPYTGEIIPLNKLFTPAYEIEHIIPQSRYFDDSLSNKVICEAAVNKLKDNQTGLEFIQNHYGQVVELGLGKSARVFTEAQYTEFVNEHYAKSRSKKQKLLAPNVPEKMIERQLNDTRYISKFVMQVLSNIVRGNIKDDGVNSKNVLACNGQITSKLKHDWGMEAVWNELILPRFERLNSLTNTTDFTVYNQRYQKHLPTVPLALQKGFQKKRIDHRHHAMDALVIACATRNHINYLNNQNALDKHKNEKSRYDLKLLLCDKKYNDGNAGNYKWVFKQPWGTFVTDAKECLEKVVVSFKQNLRVINKTVNYYEKIVDGKKVVEKQTKGENWAIRKSLHKDTVSGKVELKRIKVPKGKILTATRKSIDTSFDLKTIESVTDTGIQKILKNYLLSKDGNPDLAFSPEGIEDMNRHIEKFNDGKPHKPIYKARIFELGSKFPLGETGNKMHKYVEADKGTNLFFAIYQDENGKRNFETIPLNVIVERQKQKLFVVPEKNDRGDCLIMCLSPNDVIYVGSNGTESANIFDSTRLYRIVSFTGNRLYGIPATVAISIKDKEEFTQLNKMETTIDKISLRDKCRKVQLDRIGNIASMI